LNAIPPRVTADLSQPQIRWFYESINHEADEKQKNLPK